MNAGDTSTLPTPPALARPTGYDTELETLMQNLCHIGVPTLHKMESGWWLTLKMHVAAAGTEFRVQSEANCPTPSAAARQCTERALAALKSWAAKP